MEPITKIADGLGLDPDHLVPYGRYKAKISLDAMKDPANQKGKLVVVTGITPTPAGEGKTTTAIGLTQGMGKLGHKVSVNLREPTLGPIFGIKGGGTGGGMARVVPEDESTSTSPATPAPLARPTTFWPRWLRTPHSVARFPAWTPTA